MYRLKLKKTKDYMTLRPVYTDRKCLRFSVHFNVESICIHHWCQWVTQTQTLGVNGLLGGILAYILIYIRCFCSKHAITLALIYFGVNGFHNG